MTQRDLSLLENTSIWREMALRSGRGTGGSDLFQRVHYFDILDKAEGHASVRILQGASGPAGLSVVQSTGHEIGLEEGRALTLLLPLSGQVFSATGAQDHFARPGQAMILPRGKRRTVTARDGADQFRAIVLVLPEIPNHELLRNGLSVATSALPDLAAAARILRAVCALGPYDVAAADSAMTTARTLVAGALDDLLAKARGPSRSPSSDLALRRAEALMQDRFAEDVSVNDIARAAGISLRQMQDLFRRRFDLSPYAYLTRLRLENAHLQLKSSRWPLSVTEAALLSGFDHLGRFPGTYRARFGRLPSRARTTLP